MMAEINEMFDDLNKKKDESSFYIPSSDKGAKGFFTPIVEGEYFGHIIKVESKILDLKKTGNYRARLYKYEVEVSKENKSNNYTYKDINGKDKDTDGSAYVGKKFRGDLWRFLDPTDKDEFESNPDGNKKYLYFCEAIGVKCPKETREIDGKKVEVLSLPSITDDDILGKPVVAVVKKGRPYTNKEGKTRTFYDCKWIQKWENGKAREVGDAIPF